jgi:uncharacterized protein (TIGR03083 family)
MKQPQPILVADRFPELLDALLDLLHNLSADEWRLPTACAGWSVHDVALHLLGDDVGMLSRRRDGYTQSGVATIDGWDELVAFINAQNALWVQATRRLSPRLLCELLRLTGEQVSALFQSLDPYALGVPVSWAGPEAAPVWLDLAREFTERWHHQQHIRDAVARPGATEPRLLAPVLDAFVRALPYTYRDVAAEPDTTVVLTIEGEAGGSWYLRREIDDWRLYLETDQAPVAAIAIGQDTAWRLFTKGVDQHTAFARAALHGDRRLAAHLLETVAIIA